MNNPSVSDANAICSQHWIGQIDGFLRLLDQTLLPNQLKWIECTEVAAVWEAIKMLRIRGAPAIGIAAAYGMLLARRKEAPLDIQIANYREAAGYLATSRPTAVNLFWALRRMEKVLDRAFDDSDELAVALLAEARSIEQEDRQMCHAIGRIGAKLIPHSAVLMTHCNAGGLATSEYGTALSVFFTCQDEGKQISVFADETRPLWQGSRLTAWELQSRGIPTTVICDSMAAHVMKTRKVDAVVVGADRITARGDVANKIGTYALAIVAKHHGVPFYVAAPSSTFDLSLTDGQEIPIEQRDDAEVIQPFGIAVAPDGVGVFNPAFDVTPAELVSAIITEQGLIRPVNETNVRRLLEISQ